MFEESVSLTEGYTKTPEGDILPPLKLLAEDKGAYTEYRIWGTEIEGLYLWDRKKYDDDRGSYQELYKDELERVVGRKIDIHQTSLSRNKPRGVLRGLHGEPMDKLVTPLNGVVFIAVADIRPNSPTFGKYITFTLDQRDDEKNKKSIFVSSGLANSFLTIGDKDGEMFNYLYQTTDAYKTSEGKRSVKWDDPDLNIPWPIEPTIMSRVDAAENKSLRSLFPQKFP